jgi:hypothetical protein
MCMAEQENNALNYTQISLREWTQVIVLKRLRAEELQRGERSMEKLSLGSATGFTSPSTPALPD